MLLNLFSMIWNNAGSLLANPARTRCQYVRNEISNFEPIEPSEIDVFTIEFTQDLLNNRTADSVAFTCAIVATDVGSIVDGAPSLRILGDASLSYETSPLDGSKRTFANQKFGGFIVGNTYLINAQIQRNDGCVVARYSRVYCKAPI